MPTDQRPDSGLDGSPSDDPQTVSLGDPLAAGTLPAIPRGSGIGGAPQLVDYEVLGEAGRGGMGVVYRCRDRRVGRLVCLKVLATEAAGSNDRLSRFENEARLLGSLNHPNVCTLYDVRQTAAGPCLVLEWIEGETLGAYAARADVAAMLPVLAQVARALSAAHAAGLVHRDVKPANVMVRPDGLVKVLDFGLARLTEGGATDASGRVLVGTVPYMSPEQAGGDPIGPPSDVFSLGVVLYELVTGARPFDRGSISATLVAIASEEATPPPQAGPAVADLVSRMLAKNPAERPTAEEVAASLAVADPTASGPSLDRVAALRPRSTSRWGLAALLGAVGLTALVGATLMSGRWAGEPATRTRPSVAVLPFTNQGDGAHSYFGEGVSEDIIAMLARAPDLTVMSRSSTFPLEGQPIEVVRRDLGVDYVLEGTVKTGDEKVRIVAQLVDARTGQQMWSERFDETSEDPWALQDKVTGNIVAALTGELGQIKWMEYRRAWGADSTSLGAYDYYLRGHERYMRFTREDNEEAIRIWTEGCEAHPDSALLQVKLGFGLFMRVYLYYGGDPEVDYPRAAELTRAALGHENLSPLERRLGHWLQAYVSAQQGDYARAVREAETTLELAPFDAFQRGDLASVLILAGDTERAVEWIDQALADDPANAPFYRQLRGWALSVAGAYAASQEEFDHSIDLAAVPALRAVNHTRLGDPEAARADVARALALEPRLTLETWRHANFYRDRAILEGQLRDLATAGLP